MKYLKAVITCYLFLAVTYLLLPLGVQADLRSYAISLVSGDLTFLSATANVVPGATSLSFRNNANAATNLLINDAGLSAFPRASSTNPLMWGLSAVPADIANTSPGSIFGFVSGNDMGDFLRGSANASAPRMNFMKSRSTDGTGDTIVNSGDKLGEFEFWGSNGTDFSLAADIIVTVDGTPGSTNDMPGAIDFQLSPDGSATLASVLKLTNDKRATFSGNVVLGGSAPYVIRGSSVDGSDNKQLILSSTSSTGINPARGAAIELAGNENGDVGDIYLWAGNGIGGGKIHAGLGTSGATFIISDHADASKFTVDTSGNTAASGTVTSSRTTDLGWSVVAGANTACNTTCTSACVFGQETTSKAILACTDATADVCLCAGAS